jgi:Tfp pilus assembly protein PilF
MAVHGPDHPSVADTLTNVANLYKDQGKYDQAEANFEESLRIKMAVHGPDHPHVVVVKRNLDRLRSARE